MKSKILACAFLLLCFSVYAEEGSNTTNSFATASVTEQSNTQTASAVTVTAEEKYQIPDDLCGGLLYAGVDMWTGYNIKTKNTGIEKIIQAEELKKMLTADDESKKYYDDSEIKKIFMICCELGAAASTVYFLIESKFFDSGNINAGRPAALIASGAAIPLLLMSAGWIGNESFNDINRAVNVYNTNISCGLKKSE